MGVRGLLDAVRSFLRAETRNVRRYDLPWRYRLWLYFNGFLSSRGALWEISDDTVDQYLSDLAYRNVDQITNPYEVGLQNKFIFHLILSRTHDSLLPDIYGLVRDGRFVDLDHLSGVGSLDRLLDHLEDVPVVMKPVGAAKGDGIHVLDSTDGQFRVDGKPVSRVQLVETIRNGRDSVLQERVDQAAYAAAVFPEATNTIRILTMIDPETGDPFIATATHRFGTAASGRTDNWSAGGLSADVDPETGTLGPVILNPNYRSRTSAGDGRHPETGAQIEGLSIPAWGQITDTIRDLAGTYGSMWPHVGWDVVVRDDDGSIAVLEGEPKSVDPDQQANDPLLADPRVRRFYAHHDVISEQ